LIEFKRLTVSSDSRSSLQTNESCLVIVVGKRERRIIRIERNSPVVQITSGRTSRCDSRASSLSFVSAAHKARLRSDFLKLYFFVHIESPMYEAEMISILF
jgi:hypothetical protein